MRRTAPRFLILLILPLICAADDSTRTWSDSTGRYSIEADLGGVQDGRVELRMADGQVIAVPLDKLSQADRQYVAAVPKVIEGEVVVIADADTMTVLDVAKRQHT